MQLIITIDIIEYLIKWEKMKEMFCQCLFHTLQNVYLGVVAAG